MTMGINLGPLIAIVGSDGSGKSSVGAALLETLEAERPTRLCHLGKQSGNLARSIGRWPLIGRGVTRKIDTKTKQAITAKGPGALASLIIYAFTLRRLRRFRRMMALRAQGFTIVADRFPQMDIPHAIDGPGFGRVEHGRGLARRLAELERGHFRWMTSARPDLVLRLHVDLATASARKPDHRPADLEKKIACLPQLTFGGLAPIVDIDATQPLEAVVAQARSAISRLLK